MTLSLLFLMSSTKYLIFRLLCLVHIYQFTEFKLKLQEMTIFFMGINYNIVNLLNLWIDTGDGRCEDLNADLYNAFISLRAIGFALGSIHFYVHKIDFHGYTINLKSDSIAIHMHMIKPNQSTFTYIHLRLVDTLF